jgi:hypothetical protein
LAAANSVVTNKVSDTNRCTRFHVNICACDGMVGEVALS